MRKYFNILVAFLLFIGTIGPSLNMHFCGGRLVSYSFFNKAQKCCDASCKSCKDHSIAYKIKGDFLKYAVVLDKPVILKSDLFFTEVFHTSLIQSINVPVELTNPPPGFNYPFNITSRVLRI